jgi:hypothetical protein
MHTDRRRPSIQTILYKLLNDGAEVDYDLSRLDLMDLANSISRENASRPTALTDDPSIALIVAMFSPWGCRRAGRGEATRRRWRNDALSRGRDWVFFHQAPKVKFKAALSVFGLNYFYQDNSLLRCTSYKLQKCRCGTSPMLADQLEVFEVQMNNNISIVRQAYIFTRY